MANLHSYPVLPLEGGGAPQGWWGCVSVADQYKFVLAAAITPIDLRCAPATSPLKGEGNNLLNTRT